MHNIAYCGLACCVCAENKNCIGCQSGAAISMAGAKITSAARIKNWRAAGPVINFRVKTACWISREFELLPNLRDGMGRRS